MAGRDQQRWRRPLRRERAWAIAAAKAAAGPAGALREGSRGGPELRPDPSWPPPPPHSGTGTVRAYSVGVPRGRLLRTREIALHKGKNAGDLAGLRELGWRDQHPWIVENMPQDPVANQQPRPFCPRGGRTRLKPAVVGEGAELEGQGIGCSSPLPPLPLSPDITLELRGGGG